MNMLESRCHWLTAMHPVSVNTASELALLNLEYLRRKLGNFPNFVQLYVCVGVSVCVFACMCISQWLPFQEREEQGYSAAFFLCMKIQLL